MKKLPMSGTLSLLIVFLVLPSLTSVSAFSPQLSMAPNIRAGAGTSTNWSGYAVTGLKGSVTYVAGSWIVPTVTASAANSYSSFWVGIDGYGSNTVEQIGTDSDWVNGGPQYYAWFEFYPKASNTITTMTVSPGDVMSAEVTYSGGLFTVSIIDTTGNQQFSTSAKVPTAQRSSAEWIGEAPSSGGVLPLADFGTVDFGSYFTNIASTCYATIGGTTGAIGTFPASAIQEITMVDSSGSTIAQPSLLSADGMSFYVDRVISAATGSLTVSVSTDKASYAPGSRVYITVPVTDSTSGASISGAAVTLTVKNPNGAIASGTGVTNSNGLVIFNLKISPKALASTYTINAVATASSYNPGSGSATFQVT